MGNGRDEREKHGIGNPIKPSWPFYAFLPNFFRRAESSSSPHTGLFRGPNQKKTSELLKTFWVCVWPRRPPETPGDPRRGGGGKREGEWEGGMEMLFRPSKDGPTARDPGSHEGTVAWLCGGNWCGFWWGERGRTGFCFLLVDKMVRWTEMDFSYWNSHIRFS